MTEPARTLREAILDRLGDTLGATPDQIDPQAPFASYGLGSRDAVVLSGELEELLGRPLSPTIFYEHPTLDALVAHLTEAPDPGAHAHVPVAPAARGPIAVIGLACRFPGAPDAAAFWALLDGGKDAIRRMPQARRDLMGDDLAAMIPGHGLIAGFVEDVDAFDAPLFGIGGPEAESMDPQQRLLLELSWEALEDAGQRVDALAGSRTGVFVGLSTSDYALLRMRQPESSRIDTYFGTSNSPSVAAGRISYVFGLQGPTLAVDTACSSSLAAVHLACESLRRGESDMAIAGGINLILAPETAIWACRAKVLSEDGTCRTFDAGANGYVRGEGGGIVVLKRLSDAIRDEDAIAAVIRGSAVNHDGRSSGLTAPNGQAQQAVIASALADAGAAPEDVHYVEAHGTGTVLGDPIEVRALGAALCRNRPASDPLVIGSVKTNVGHLEAAAGVAGLIKVVLGLREGRIPPHVNLRSLNPLIKALELPLDIPDRSRTWPADWPAAVAGVSAFGLSGTNVHVILGPAPVPGRAVADAPASGSWVLPLSGRDRPALDRRARSVLDWLRRERPAVQDVCLTAGVRRAHQRSRLAVWGDSLDEVSEALQAFVNGEPHPRAVSGTMTGSAARATEGESASGSFRADRAAARYVAGEAVDWRAGLPAGARVRSLPGYPFDRSRYWLAPRPVRSDRSGESGASVLDPDSFEARLAAVDPSEREAAVAAYLREGLGRALQTPADDVPLDVPLVSLGLDSLMAIDLHNRLATDVGVQAPTVDLLEKMTVKELSSLVLDLREAALLSATRNDGGAAGTEEFVL